MMISSSRMSMDMETTTEEKDKGLFIQFKSLVTIPVEKNLIVVPKKEINSVNSSGEEQKRVTNNLLQQPSCSYYPIVNSSSSASNNKSTTISNIEEELLKSELVKKIVAASQKKFSCGIQKFNLETVTFVGESDKKKFIIPGLTPGIGRVLKLRSEVFANKQKEPIIITLEDDDEEAISTSAAEEPKLLDKETTVPNSATDSSEPSLESIEKGTPELIRSELPQKETPIPNSTAIWEPTKPKSSEKKTPDSAVSFNDFSTRMVIANGSNTKSSTEANVMKPDNQLPGSEKPPAFVIAKSPFQTSSSQSTFSAFINNIEPPVRPPVPSLTTPANQQQLQQQQRHQQLESPHIRVPSIAHGSAGLNPTRVGPAGNGIQMQIPEGQIPPRFQKQYRTELPANIIRITKPGNSQPSYSATRLPDRVELQKSTSCLAASTETVGLDHNYQQPPARYSQSKRAVPASYPLDPPVYIDAPSGSTPFVSTPTPRESGSLLSSLLPETSTWANNLSSSVRALNNSYDVANLSSLPSTSKTQTSRKGRPESPRKSNLTSDLSDIPAFINSQGSSSLLQPGPPGQNTLGTTTKEKTTKKRVKTSTASNKLPKNSGQKNEAKKVDETRCICGYTHDDGYMICCDDCNVWQHVDCVGLTPDRLPVMYYCELCKERPVDVDRARSIQLRKLSIRDMEALEDNEAEKSNLSNIPIAAGEGEVSRKRGRPSLSNGIDGRLSSNKKSDTNGPLSRHNNRNSGKFQNKNNIGGKKNDIAAEPRVKRSYVRKNSSLNKSSLDSSLTTKGTDSVLSDLPNGSSPLYIDDPFYVSPNSSEASNEGNGRNRPRKQMLSSIANGHLSPTTSLVGKESSLLDGHNKSNLPTNEFGNLDAEHIRRRHTSRLNSYEASPDLEDFEEAEICHYSQELRARLKLFDVASPAEVPDLNEHKRWQLQPFELAGGKSMRILRASALINQDEHIIELKGKIKLLTQFQTELRKSSKFVVPEPFLFFYRIPGKDVDVSIDCKRFGNAARFVRRSCTPNAKLVSIVGKCVIHVFICATKRIEEGEEVTIPHEADADLASFKVGPLRLPCANEDPNTTNCTCMEPLTNRRTKRMSSTQEATRPAEVQPESQDRKLRVGSRRTSNISAVTTQNDKPVDQMLDEPSAANTSAESAVQQQSPVHQTSVLSPDIVNTSAMNEIEKSIEPMEISDVESSNTTPIKSERGRDQKVKRSSSRADEDYNPPTTRKTRELNQPHSNKAGRRRNRSSTTDNDSPTAADATNVEKLSDPKTPMSREDRKLAAYLKLFEKLDESERRKETRTQKKESAKDGEELTMPTTLKKKLPYTPANKPSPRRPSIAKKRKGKLRAGSRGTKPQQISQRSSGSLGDLRTTSTESDEPNQNQEPENRSSFQLPRTRKQTKDETIEPVGVGGFPKFTNSTDVRPQYIRKNNSNASSGSNAPVPIPSTGSTAPSSSGVSNCESWKKRYLRNMPSSEEVDTSNVNSPSPSSLSANNSRPNSPGSTIDYVPPKKRRLARTSMSSEVSSTPASPPNPQISDHDMETESAELSDKKITPSSSEDEGKSGNSKHEEAQEKTKIITNTEVQDEKRPVPDDMNTDDSAQEVTANHVAQADSVISTEIVSNIKSEELTDKLQNSELTAVEKSNIEKKRKMSILEYRTRKTDSSKDDGKRRRSPPRGGSGSDSMESPSNSNDSSLFRLDDAKNDSSAFSSEPTEAEKKFETMSKRKHLFDSSKKTLGTSSFNGPSLAVADGDTPVTNSTSSRVELSTSSSFGSKLVTLTAAQRKLYHEPISTSTDRPSVNNISSLRSQQQHQPQVPEIPVKLENNRSTSQTSAQVRPPLPNFTAVSRLPMSSHPHLPFRNNSGHEQVIGGVTPNLIPPLPPPTTSPGQGNAKFVSPGQSFPKYKMK